MKSVVHSKLVSRFYEVGVDNTCSVLALYMFHWQLTAGESERILVMGATNRPQELDDAALR